MEFKSGTSATPPTEQQLKSFERDYRVQLPQDICFHATNRQWSRSVDQPIFSGTRDRIIERMLCFLIDPNAENLHGSYDIDVVITQLDSRLVVDPDASLSIIPFASLYGGDFVCFDFRDDVTNPTVAVWEHELSTEYAPHLVLLAGSFVDFDRLLRVA